MTISLHNDTAEVFVPDGTPADEALARTTHMAVGAHQDDLEIFAADGILRCFGRDDRWFTGVTLTNGSGSPRSGLYGDYTDDEMQQVRRREQKKAAYVGEYAAQALLDYPSAAVKDGGCREVEDDLVQVFARARPEVVYTHNPADKHDTHVGSLLKTVNALRRLEHDQRPATLYGVEVWRDLDWLPDEEKVMLDVSAHDNIAAALVGVFDSQVCGGKRYDLATMGRRRAQATYAASHGVDEAELVTYAVDLTPLLADDDLDVGTLIHRHLDAFAADVAERLQRLG